MKPAAKSSLGQGQLMLWILGGSIVAFAAMFLFLHFSGVNLNTTPPREPPHIAWMPPANQNAFSPSDPRYLAAELFDPSLMSLPSTHGFSRNMWGRKIEATQRNLGWNEEPAYLDEAAPRMPAPLLEAIPVDAAALAAADKAQPLSEESNDNEPIELPASVNQSVVRVLGSLEDRAVVSGPQIPVITNSAPLRPTQVRVGVGADGQVLYVLLDKSSGDDTVDSQALDLATRIRFGAEHDSSSLSVTWGVLRFIWATQPPATTNMDGSSSSK